MSFLSNQYDIRRLFNKTIYEIPRNQRDYVWNQRQWEELFNDLLFIMDFPDQGKRHFIGSFVFKDNGDKTGIKYYKIVDGQQRLATLTMLICAIQRVFHANSKKNEFGGLASYLYVEDDNKSRFNIINSTAYFELNKLVDYVNQEIDAEAIKQDVNQILKKMSLLKEFAGCFKYFTNKIITSFGSDMEKLIKFRDTLLSTQFIEIVAKDDEDTYTIFEILNARGKPLEDGELLKNYIMRYIMPINKRDDVEQTWVEMTNLLGKDFNRFIKHYANHKFCYTKSKLGQSANQPDSPYKAIRDKARSVFGDDAIQKLLTDLREKANIYSQLLNPNKDAMSPEEYQLLYLLKQNKNEQYRPLIMSLRSQQLKGNLSDNEYLKILKFLYQFYTCYTIICGGLANSVEDIIYKKAEQIEQEYSSTMVEELERQLKNKIPNKTTFISMFMRIGYSHNKSFFDDESRKKQVQTILRLYENYLHPETWELEFTIEHILPDSKNTDNAIIGNLIPLEARLNGRLADKDLSEKIQVYETESSFISARKFASNYKGKDFNPYKRTEYMAKEFYEKILCLEG